MVTGLEYEDRPAYIFYDGKQVSCPRCPEVQTDFKKEVATFRHYCEICGTFYETAEQVIEEMLEKEGAQSG